MKTVIRIILIVLLGLTFYTIFQFSSENSEVSSKTSGNLMRKIIDIFPYTKNLSEQEKEKIVERAQPIIRKLAHFSIYAVEVILMMSLVYTYNLEFCKKVSISILVGLFYATSDEIHQSFVPGRSGQWQDILLDTFGVCVGIMVVILMVSLFEAFLGQKAKK